LQTKDKEANKVLTAAFTKQSYHFAWHCQMFAQNAMLSAGSSR